MLGFASNVAQHQQNQLYSNAPTFAVNPNQKEPRRSGGETHQIKQTGVRAASGGSSSHQPNANIVRISASSNDNQGVAKIVRKTNNDT
jgi:hypothetical protein